MRFQVGCAGSAGAKVLPVFFLIFRWVLVGFPLSSLYCVLGGRKCLPEPTLYIWVESQEPQRLSSTLVLPLDRGLGSPKLAGAAADDSLDYCCQYMWDKGVSSHKWVPTVATALGHCHWVSGFLLNSSRVCFPFQTRESRPCCFRFLDILDALVCRPLCCPGSST